MQINRNPKLMIVLLVVAMIGGTLFSIVWAVVWPRFHTSLVLGSLEPPEKAGKDERGEYYRTRLEKAINNKLPAEVIACTAFNYAEWFRFEKWNYREAKKAYDRCVELCNVKDASGDVRTIQADAMIASADIDHHFYLTGDGKPPDPEIALKAQKQQIQAAHDMGYTNDANDVQRQRRAQEQIATFLSDNKDYSRALKYINEAEEGARRNNASPYSQASVMVRKARALTGLGKTAEADKLFIAAIKVTDDAYGGGSEESESCLHLYSDPLIRDGQVERGNKVKEQQDDDNVW